MSERLEFLLQATDDPTLIVPAAVVWRTRGTVLSKVGRRLEDPQERWLEDLGRALRLFEPLAAALREPAPTALLLDSHDAYEFLRESASALEQAGYGLLVPSWWGTRRARLGLRLRARPPRHHRSEPPGMVCSEWKASSRTIGRSRSAMKR